MKSAPELAVGLAGVAPARTPAPVQLAICTTGELFGGVERHVLGLCEYVHRLTGVFPLLVLFHDHELAHQARAIGLAPVVLRARHRYDPALARQLVRVLAEAHVNVVHAHGYKAMIACALAKSSIWAAGARAGRSSDRFAVVKTEHGRIEPAHGDPMDWTKSRLNRALDVWATRRAAYAVGYVTRELARDCERVHRSLRREVIYNGIDRLDKTTLTRPAALEQGPFHLGVVGRLTKVKGVVYALRAVASQGVPEGVRLNIIGEGPQEKALRREASALGLDKRVRFLGFRKNVYDYLAHLDVLLIPSLHEGLPYSLLEAMSVGTPVVASRVGGLAEVLRDGESGLLVPVGDVAALRRAIVRVATDPALRQELGRAAFAEHGERYTLEAMGKRYWNLYADGVAETVGAERTDRG